MRDWTEFIKSIVRPFIIIWGFVVYGICVMTQVPVPDVLVYLVAVVIVEYFGERAIKRLKKK